MINRNILCLFVITHAFVASFASVVIRVPLYNQDNSTYYGQMQIGTPPQNFKVMFDNFAAAIIVPSVACTNDICQPHAKYNPQQSSTAYEMYSDWTIGASNFGLDYSCSGTTANDTITLGGIKVPSVSFVEVTDYTGEDFKNAPFDVIFGLQIADPIFVDHPFYAQLKTLGQIVDPKFSVSLSSQPGNSGSFFMIGGYDISKAPNGFNLYDVANPAGGSWIIMAEDFGLGNTSYATGLNGTIYLGVDMGTESSYGGAGPIENMISALGFLDCANIQNYPDFYVTIQGTKYLLPASNYILGPEESCQLGFQPDINFDDSVLILGSHFIRAHYTVFDFEANQIGIAKSTSNQEEISQ